MANIVTLSRISMAISLLFVGTCPVSFWTLYLLCGISDVLDGEIARRTGTESRLGERLDTLADIVFFAVWLVLFLPAVNVGKWVWIWVGVIALVKVVNVVSGFVLRKTFVAKHTVANKMTGVLLFLLPAVLQSGSLTIPSLVLTGFVATFAAIQEGHLIRTEDC